MKLLKMKDKIPYKAILTDKETINIQSKIPKTTKSTPLQQAAFLTKGQYAHLSKDSSENSKRQDLDQIGTFENTVLTLQKKREQLQNIKMEKRNNKRRQKSLYTNEKIKRICNMFVNKLKRNNTCTSISIGDNDLQHYFSKQYIQGIQVNQRAILAHKIISAFTIFILILSQSFVFAFSQLKNNIGIQITLILSAIIFLFQIGFNLIVIKRVQGHHINNLQDIIFHYMKSGYLFIDSTIFILIIFNLAYPDSSWNLVLLFTLLLEVENLACKLSNLQQYMVKNYYYEKYLSLLKIMIFNFIFAHFIAVLLNQVAVSNYGHSWQTVKGIEQGPWEIRYIWSYYWATTIMLTVGFGDIVPTNENQALCIIFIQFTSCIAFSYNISCLGALISNIKSQTQETQKNRKIFEGMDKKINFSSNLFSRIEHFINESAYVRSKFNISEQKTFIQNLPAGYRKQLMCQTNKKLLKSLPFFSCLLDKTIYRIAHHLQRHIYYPQQTIKAISNNFAIYVLQNGRIGYACKKFGSKYNNVIANEVKVKENSQPFVLAQEFITLQKLNFDIRSLGYSVIHELNYQKFLEQLQKVKKDYEFYNFLRDKAKNVDEYETIVCDICESKHTRFDCPKYHFIPIHQNVKLRYIKREKADKSQRLYNFERTDNKFRSLSSSHIKNLQNQIGYRDIFKSDGFIKLKHKLSQKQQQMKNFVINFYDFYKNIQNQKDKIQLIEQQNYSIQSSKMVSCQLDEYEQFWIIQCDSGYNYDIYFPQSNPSHLVKRYNLQRRLVKTIKGRKIIL